MQKKNAKIDVRVQEECHNIDWSAVSNLLKLSGMAYHEPEVHKRAFHNSFSVVFLFDKDKLVGFGRAISDAAYQAAVYDVVVAEEYRKLGLGRLIMERILEKVNHCNVMLYASPGRERFYVKLGFRLMKTAMARYLRPDLMEEKGFIQ
jgi:GNAT superfamily N-acetyltransferase